MKIAWAVIAVFFSRFIVTAWFTPTRDGDIAWQRWLGQQVLAHHEIPRALGLETFTAAGAHWIPQEWLFSVGVFSTLRGGDFAILALVCALAAAAALFVTAYRAHIRGASTFAITLTTAFTGFAMVESFGARAQVFAWPLLAVLLLLLDLETNWIFLAIPLVALWANLHASALVAPVFIGAWAIGTAVEDRAWTPRVERNVVLTAGTALAVFLTPFLWQLPAYAVGLQTSTIRDAIAEWQPLDLTYGSVWAGFLPLLAICCCFGIAAPRERWRDGMLFAASSALAFSALRHLPLCAIVIAPMAAQRLTSAIPQHARVNAVLAERLSELLVYGATAVATVLIAVDLTHAPAVAGNLLPRAAISALARTSGEHNLYCEDFAWCSLALQEPNLRTFIDGRCDPFPMSVWRDYLSVRRVAPNWSALLNRHRVDAMLVDPKRPLAQALALQRHWRVFYRDGKFEIFVRRST